MCTKNEDQVNVTNSVKGSDVNVTINRQQQTKYVASNLNKSDNQSVDFRIHTNIELITNKKIKIFLLINILITVICITTSFIITYKLYAELLRVQNELISLNNRIDSLTDTYDQFKYDDHINMKTYGDAEAQPQVMEDMNIKDGNYELVFTNSRNSKLSRLRRANRRNNEKRRKVKSSGIFFRRALAAHFKGSVPEIYIKDQVPGLVGPWYLDNSVSRQFKFPKFHLTEGQCAIEVTEPALYLIYAQVYYISSNAINSYSVYVRSEGSSENNIIAKCSTVGPSNSHTSEISCYTSTVHSLKANDRIFIQQTEKNRTIILRDGHSFFGLVRLNNAHRIKK